MAHEILETVLIRTTRDGTPFVVKVEYRWGGVLAVAYLDGKQLGHGGEVGYPLPKAYGDLTHGAGYPPARVVGLTTPEVEQINAAVQRHHNARFGERDAKQALKDKLGGLLDDFTAAREAMDFTKARKIESEIAAAREAAGLDLNGWRK